MMIWFAGILQNACCNNANKNKTTTNKTLSCECGLLTRNYAHLLTLSVESTCSTVKTQRTNFSISGTSKIIYFCGFLALPPLFFRRLMETSHLGAPLEIFSHTWRFSTLFYSSFWMRSWRNAWRRYLFRSGSEVTIAEHETVILRLL